jgi:hypothetical protein
VPWFPILLVTHIVLAITLLLPSLLLRDGPAGCDDQLPDEHETGALVTG